MNEQDQINYARLQEYRDENKDDLDHENWKSKRRDEWNTKKYEYN